MSEMNIKQIKIRIQEMLIYYAHKKEETTGQEHRDYETKFYTLKQLEEDILYNRSLAEPYRRVVDQVCKNNHKH
jgi:hypothetical protein